MKGPPKKGKRAVGSALVQTDVTDCPEQYHSLQALQAEAENHWRREDARLLTEYRRTGDSKHLVALRRHRVGVRDRMRAWKEGAQV